MKIGIMNSSDILKFYNPLNFCDKIILLGDLAIKSDLSFENVLPDIAPEDTFHANSLVALDSSLNDLFPIFQSLMEKKKIIIFLKRPERQSISDEQYFHLLWELVQNEHRLKKDEEKTILRRPEKSIKKIGRPRIDSDKAAKIKKLYKEEYKTIREIATICNVSLGTAFKYANK